MRQVSHRFLSPSVFMLSAALLIGCNQTDPPPDIAPRPAIAEVALSGAVASSNTSILVTMPTDALLVTDPARYILTAEGGAKVAVTATYPLPDGHRIVLATAPQPSGTELLSIGRGPSIKFVASSVSAPTIQSGLALSSTRLLLRFAETDGTPAVLLDSAANPSHYQVSGVGVTGAVLSADKSAVALTIDQQTDSVYAVTAQGVLTTGYAVSGGASTLQGIPAQDTRSPAVLSASAPDRQTLVIKFSEPLAAAVPGNFTVTGPTGVPIDVIDAAFTDEFHTAVRLGTSMQQDGAYTVRVSGVTDVAMNGIEAAGAGANFTGTGAVDTTPPRLSSAGATSSTSVIVTFSEPVKGGPNSAENPAHYQVTGTASSEGLGSTGAAIAAGAIRAQSATLVVVAAKLLPNKTAVELTTLQQSGVQYQLQVTNVSDLAGNQIAPPAQGTSPSTFTFSGQAASGGGLDTDKDNLSDAEEQRGWVITIHRQDGTSFKREVTSDPLQADTDKDGVSDRDERTYLLDPRLADTDADQVSDFDELGPVNSDPTDQDTDHDGLSDGKEVLVFKTSPLFADTDGDQIGDGKEVLLDNRNPLVADLPVPSLTVGNVDLQLDERFTATNGKSTRTLESRTASSTLSENQSVSRATSDSNTTEWFIKAGAQVGFEASAEPKVTVGFSAEGGVSGSATSSFTNESARSSQQEYLNSLTTDKEVARDETVTREITGATMAVALNLKALGNGAFTIRNLEITALIEDPNVPGQFIPVATLLPEGGASAGVNVGPLVSERGPFRFSTTKATPRLVEALMRNPKGVFFRIANYDITDELGRNFAFTSQDITDRTAELGIDYSGLHALELYRIATNSTFNEANNPVGTTVQHMLEDSLHLKHYDSASDAGLNQTELMNSYSTIKTGGIEKLWRVRDVSQGQAGNRKKWFFLTKTGIDETINFGSTPVKSGATLRLAFAQDLDNDGLTLAQENLYGSSDNNADNDGDGIKDGEEVNGVKGAGGARQPWRVGFNDAQQGYETASNPGRADTDLDGLTDNQELLVHHTDPANPDTDGDGIADAAEVGGYTIRSVTDGKPFTATSDPLSRDTDGDGLPDDRERRVGTNPGVSDADNVLDDDGDGLVNIEETTGQPGSYTDLGGVSETFDGKSLKNKPDSDGDGLSDNQERVLGTNPMASDTDGDGLTDKQEVDGLPFRADTANPIRKTNPLKADTDADGLSDGTELKSFWTVKVDGTAPYDVYSDPLDPDFDRDRLLDKDERLSRSDPTSSDTDKDGSGDGDEKERETQVLVPDYQVTVKYRLLTIGGGIGTGPSSAACDEDGLGEFDFNLQVIKPGGIVPTSIAGPESVNWPKKTTVTGGNGLGGVLTLSAVELNVIDSLYINAAITFSLPFTETFTIQGRVDEVDIINRNVYYDSRMHFLFGGVGANESNFSGSTLQKGTKDFVYKQEITQSNPCSMYVYGSYTVR